MRSALSSAAAMWFPSSNNVSVIYERPTTIPAQPPQHCTISSPYHNKLTPNSALTHIHPKEALRGAVCIYSTCMCVAVHSTCASLIKLFLSMNACVNFWKKEAHVRNSPFGGGLTSVSPCWFELSDCPDCSTWRTERDSWLSGQISGHHT